MWSEVKSILLGKGCSWRVCLMLFSSSLVLLSLLLPSSCCHSLPLLSFLVSSYVRSTPCLQCGLKVCLVRAVLYFGRLKAVKCAVYERWMPESSAHVYGQVGWNRSGTFQHVLCDRSTFVSTYVFRCHFGGKIKCSPSFIKLTHPPSLRLKCLGEGACECSRMA